MTYLDQLISTLGNVFRLGTDVFCFTSTVHCDDLFKTVSDSFVKRFFGCKKSIYTLPLCLHFEETSIL